MKRTAGQTKVIPSNTSKICAALLFLTAGATQASALYGATAGVRVYQPDLQAQFGEASDAVASSAEVKETVQAFYFTIEHPIPFVPNYKFSTLSSNAGGETTLEQTFVLDQQLFSVATSLVISADYRFLDNTLYYEIIDSGLVELDLGVNLRHQSADFTVVDQQNSVTAKREVNEWLPLAYAKVKVGAPLTGVSAMAELDYEDSDNHHWQFALGYQFASVGVASATVLLGYQRTEQDWQDVEGIYANNDWASAFAGLEFSF